VNFYDFAVVLAEFSLMVFEFVVQSPRERQWNVCIKHKSPWCHETLSHW